MIDLAGFVVLGLGTELQAALELLQQLANPGQFLRVFVDGLAKSGVYVMITVGLTLIFGLMGVLNFAHGAFVMIGAYFGGVLITSYFAGLVAGNPVVALLVFGVIMALAFGLLAVVGGALEVSTVRQLYDHPPIFQILLTFGLTLVLEEAMRILVGYFGVNSGDYQTTWDAALGARPGILGGYYDLAVVQVRGLWLLQIFLGALTVVGTWAFLTKTRYGLFVRAGSEDDEMAQALGIDVRQVFTVVFAIGAGVAGAAGVLAMWDQSWGASVPLALAVLLPAFVIVIVGGLGTFKGTIVASVLVGMVHAVTEWSFTNAPSYSTFFQWVGLPEMMIFGILVVMLILRPQGLYGVEGAGEH